MTGEPTTTCPDCGRVLADPGRAHAHLEGRDFRAADCPRFDLEAAVAPPDPLQRNRATSELRW